MTPIRRVPLAAPLTLAVLLSGCSANYRSIYRHTELKPQPSLTTMDARQRAVLHLKTEGFERLCAEPSPDVFSTLSAAIEANASYDEKVKANMKLALSEAAATIGTRTETIQLLRDAMYRLCELALNGQLDGEQAYDLHLRYQKSMVTLAAVAALADTARPTQVALTGDAAVAVSARVDALKKDVEAQGAKVEAAKPVDAAAREALAKAVEPVCATKVTDDDPCKKDLASCKEAGQGSGTELCKLEIDGKAAEDDTSRLGRVTTFCGTKSTEPCKTFLVKKTERDATKKALEEAQSALEETQAELAAAEAGSDVLARSKVVALAPVMAQPSQANLREVAAVVDRLVTQVYADAHVDRCIELLADRKAWMETFAAADVKLSVLPKTTGADEQRTMLESEKSEAGLSLKASEEMSTYCFLLAESLGKGAKNP